MGTQILNELKEIRKLLSILVGSQDMPKEQQFSIEALDRAANEFKKMMIERGEWVSEDDIHKIIRKAHYYSGRFIIEHFGFNHYFKSGRATYFNRKSLIALNMELKSRNINLERYMELLRDKEKFQQLIETTKQKGKKRKRFHIPDGLKDIDTTPYPPPPEEIILNHIESLKEEFQRFKLYEYVDVYDDNHAMFKHLYYLDKYLDPVVKKRSLKWCEDFNYANYALKEVKKPWEVPKNRLG